jgi:hypothetical protein
MGAHAPIAFLCLLVGGWREKVRRQINFFLAPASGPRWHAQPLGGKAEFSLWPARAAISALCSTLKIGSRRGFRTFLAWPATALIVGDRAESPVIDRRG